MMEVFAAVLFFEMLERRVAEDRALDVEWGRIPPRYRDPIPRPLPMPRPSGGRSVLS